MNNPSGKSSKSITATPAFMCRQGGVRRRLFLAAAGLTVAVSTAAKVFDEPENWGMLLFESYTAEFAMPKITRYMPEATLEDAMAIQNDYVARRVHIEGVLGYQATLMDYPAQRRFGVREPVTGALLQGDEVLSGSAIDPDPRANQWAEINLGFVLDRAVHLPVNSDEDAAALFHEVVPVITISRPSYDAPGANDIRDLLAVNLALRHVIRGAPLPAVDAAALNGVFVEFYRDDVIVDRGKGANVMGNQLAAFRWTVNAILERGWSLQAGQLIVTGGMGEPVAAFPGHYRVELRDIGAVDFTVGPHRDPEP
ncbi:MAG: hypothetical protein H6978_11110 [Gammaproteobacteria bacterium]|nr:hypothetical protein [Gammaproteobacteria bacterium]